jgi:adenylate cyclase
VQRRLAAILAADVVGFSTHMGLDEEGTLARIRNLRREVIEPKVSDHQGRVVKTTGDGFLVEFASPVEAVRCAVEVQDLLTAKGSQEPSQALQIRIGINLGDIIIEEDGDIYGDGVNVAARLEQLADPGGICISGKIYEEVRDKVPYGFDDQGEQQVKNIARPVRVYRLSSELQTPTNAFPLKSHLPLPDKPSIAVMAFTNLGGDPEQGYFADGMTEEIITGLSRLKWLLVIARTSTFMYKSGSVDVRQIARDLGVRYILEGSVRTGGNRIRVMIQLIEAETGKHMWAEKFDRQVTDVFALQDEITENVIAAIEPHLYAEEGARAKSQSPEKISSWGLVVRAIGLINKVARAENEEARSLLERAITSEPTYARAHAILSWGVWWAASNYWLPDRQEGLEKAKRCAEEALTLDPNEPWARMVLGLCLSEAGQHDRALQEFEVAIDINPSFALARAIHGWVLARDGRFDAAVEETSKALRLSPRDTLLSFYGFLHGMTLLTARRFAEALPYLRKTITAFPELPVHFTLLISCCGHLGLIDEARALLTRRNTLGPPLTVSYVRYQLREYATRDVIAEGLAKAGVPEC